MQAHLAAMALLDAPGQVRALLDGVVWRAGAVAARHEIEVENRPSEHLGGRVELIVDTVNEAD